MIPVSFKTSQKCIKTIILAISVNDVVDKFRCKIDTVKTNTRSDVPTRKHYSRDPRVGEVLLEGRAGVTFYKFVFFSKKNLNPKQYFLTEFLEEF